MKEIDITEEIQQLYLEKKLDRIAEEVEEELKHGVPQRLKDQLSKLLNNIEKMEGTVVSFPTPAFRNLAQIELLAAAPKEDVGDLADQPLVCLSKGFTVDIRRVLGSENSVTLYFQPVNDGEDKMEEVFSPYKGETVTLEFVLNGVQLLTASIYVDESARQAEGEGVILNSDVDMKDPKIEINVSVDE